MGTHPIFESDFDCLTVCKIRKGKMTLFAATRKHLKGVDAFIQQTDDAHGSEYTCPTDNRRPEVSGFTGSAGTAVFTKTEAALWTDGRYFLQASQQLDKDWIMMKDGIPETPSITEWLIEKVPVGGVVGCDGLCTRFATFENMKKDFESAGRKLEAIPNPIDAAWEGRPARPSNPLEIMSDENAGQKWQDKVANVRIEIKKKNTSGLIITMLDEICWLFNIRGSDIPFNPLFFCYCYISLDSIILFMNEKQATDEIKKHLNGVTIKPYDSTIDFLKSLSSKTLCSGNSPAGIVQACASREVITDTPVGILKSIKNKKDIYLLDAGAHYTCGTTDTTRTIHCGTPTAFQKECYTRVLQGHVNLIQAVFPEGTRGPALDVLARSPLWEAGLDFKHGTGHGIGCWLNVHEPPVGLYLSPRADCVAQSQNHFYKPGYCVTDEPGFYKDGEFGMRIENAIYVKEAKTKFNLPNGQKFLEFESLCFVPMCLKLIDNSLLSDKQRTWINEYHQKCRDKLIPAAKEQNWNELIPWIEQNTIPL